jgi:hypothetical protein
MWRGVVAFGRLRLLADAGSVGGNRAIGKTCRRQRRDRQPLDLQPLRDLVAVAEQLLPRHAERIEHVDRRGNFVISSRFLGAAQRDAQLLVGLGDGQPPLVRQNLSGKAGPGLSDFRSVVKSRHAA